MKNCTTNFISKALGTGMFFFLGLMMVACHLQTDTEPINPNTVTAGVQVVPTPPSHPTGIVSLHGRLKVIGTKLCDKNGDPVELKGMSAHHLKNYPWTSSTVVALIKQYHNSMIRAAMYIEEEGYLTDPAGMKAREKILIDAAIANDIYVIIDWHGVGGDPNKYTTQAKAFFQEMSATYGSCPNVIYEIYNEPTVDWGAIKNYANQIIPVIRANDPNSVIVVGTLVIVQPRKMP
jgi:endoglucanase